MIPNRSPLRRFSDMRDTFSFLTTTHSSAATSIRYAGERGEGVEVERVEDTVEIDEKEEEEVEEEVEEAEEAEEEEGEGEEGEEDEVFGEGIVRPGGLGMMVGGSDCAVRGRGEV